MDPINQLDELIDALDGYHAQLLAARDRAPDGTLSNQLDELAGTINQHKSQFREAYLKAHGDADKQLATAKSSCQQAVQKAETVSKQAAQKAQAAPPRKAAARRTPKGMSAGPAAAPAESDPELGSILRRELLMRIVKRKKSDSDDDRDLWELDWRDWDE